MRIKKAIFPVGGLGTRFLPATKAMPKEMLPVVDKPLIQYAVEEAISAGIEQFIFVTGRNKTTIEDHFDYSTELEHVLIAKDKKDALESIRNIIQTPGSVTYVRQQEPAGLGHAVWCARHLIAKEEAVAVLLADDLILGPSTLGQMIQHYNSGHMLALMDVSRKDTGSYGIITPGKTVGSLTEILSLIEKPDPEHAPSTKAVVGRYILEASIFDRLETSVAGANGEIQLTDALAASIGHTALHGFHCSGERFDCGSKLGFLKANIAFALSRPELRESLHKWMTGKL